MTVLQVTGVKESTVSEAGDTNEDLVLVGGQKCLMSTSDEGNEGLEKFLRDKLDSLSCEGLERIVEVDPTVALELLDKNLVDLDNVRGNVIPVDEELPKTSVDDILRAEVNEKRLGSVSKRSLCVVDADVVDERPSKSVAFQFDNAAGILSSAGCELVGVSDAGQSFPYSSDRMILIMAHLN